MVITSMLNIYLATQTRGIRKREQGGERYIFEMEKTILGFRKQNPKMSSNFHTPHE